MGRSEGQTNEQKAYTILYSIVPQSHIFSETPSRSNEKSLKKYQESVLSVSCIRSLVRREVALTAERFSG